MRRWPLALGAVVLAAAWFSPLPGLVPGTFSQHMSVHMAVVALAAPLLALGIAGARFDPVRRLPRLFPPIPMSVLELAIVWAWHAPALHHFARHSFAGYALEQGTFLLSALAVWLSSFRAGRAQRSRVGAGVVALLLTSMHMTLLGALLALPPRPLYAHAHGSDTAHALADQHLGGAIMLLAGGASYLIGALWLTGQLLRPWLRPQRRASTDPAAIVNPP